MLPLHNGYHHLLPNLLPRFIIPNEGKLTSEEISNLVNYAITHIDVDMDELDLITSHMPLNRCRIQNTQLVLFSNLMGILQKKRSTLLNNIPFQHRRYDRSIYNLLIPDHCEDIINYLFTHTTWLRLDSVNGLTEFRNEFLWDITGLQGGSYCPGCWRIWHIEHDCSSICPDCLETTWGHHYHNRHSILLPRVLPNSILEQIEEQNSRDYWFNAGITNQDWPRLRYSDLTFDFFAGANLNSLVPYVQGFAYIDIFEPTIFRSFRSNHVWYRYAWNTIMFHTHTFYSLPSSPPLRNFIKGFFLWCKHAIILTRIPTHDA